MQKTELTPYLPQSGPWPCTIDSWVVPLFLSKETGTVWTISETGKNFVWKIKKTYFTINWYCKGLMKCYCIQFQSWINSHWLFHTPPLPHCSFAIWEHTIYLIIKLTLHIHLTVTSPVWDDNAMENLLKNDNNLLNLQHLINIYFFICIHWDCWSTTWHLYVKCALY